MTDRRTRIHYVERYIWRAMIQRCTDPKNKAWERYGGRGIRVCRRWRDSFESFLNDVGCRPSPRHTIDRINNRAGYKPGNVRWATQKEQQRNRRNNRYLTLDGRTMMLDEWASVMNINPGTIWGRLGRGWSTRRALTEPIDVSKRNRYAGSSERYKVK